MLHSLIFFEMKKYFFSCSHSFQLLLNPTFPGKEQFNDIVSKLSPFLDVVYIPAALVPQVKL